jgi:glycosyltransferase involved in cell wall biosynthesis
MQAFKNRIAVLTVVRHPVGGIRTYLKYTYGRLDPDKYHFTIITAAEPEAKLILEDLRQYHVELVEISGGKRELKIIREVMKRLRHGSFHLVHSQGFTAGVLSVLGNCISRTPHIMTSHDVFRKGQFISVAGYFKKVILQWLFMRIDVIQSVSHDAQDNLVQFLPALGKHGRKLTVIPNGIQLRVRSGQQDSGKLSLHATFELDRDLFIFGFLGRFMEQKGFIYIIQAVAELAQDSDFSGQFRLLAVNDGAFIREYKELIRQEGLSAHFLFHRFVPDVADILSELNVLVMPSLWEAYPLLPAEAMALGCPVISSDCIGLREATRETPAIVVKAGDAHALADAMRHAMTNSTFIKQEALAFAPIARERFSSDHTALLLDGLFAEVLARRSSQ